MKTTQHFPIVVSLLIACAAVAHAKECSTEKVNGDCTITIDRSYPVNLPAIPMRPGKTIQVRIVNPLPFESLLLELQNAQAAAGTDQTAGFITAALPNLKNLMLLTEKRTLTVTNAPELTSVRKYKHDRDNLKAQMNSFMADATQIYTQLNEALGSIPPEVLPDGPRPKTSKVLPTKFPRPWRADEYPRWRDSMICEIAGGHDCDTDITALLARGTALVTALGPCPASDIPSPPPLACEIPTVRSDIAALPAKQQEDYAPFLQSLSADSATLAAASAEVAAVNKDLGTYYANIERSAAISPPDPLGTISDPRDGARNAQLPKFLGRPVTYAVNAVNEVATFNASVIGASQKKLLVTINAVYADPIFEVSAGAFFSTLANRSFANQTLVTQNPGTAPTTGNIQIAQTITRPTIVPFAAANWRIGPNFTWPDHRRLAFYFTAAVGLNPNNTTTEFAFGPSISWRSLMFSPLFHWGRDVRLTQGETVGQVWCTTAAASITAAIPACTGAPPAASTEKYWAPAFALGVSIRVPTLFGSGH